MYAGLYVNDLFLCSGSDGLGDVVLYHRFNSMCTVCAKEMVGGGGRRRREKRKVERERDRERGREKLRERGGER